MHHVSLNYLYIARSLRSSLRRGFGGQAERLLLSQAKGQSERENYLNKFLRDKPREIIILLAVFKFTRTKIFGKEIN